MAAIFELKLNPPKFPTQHMNHNITSYIWYFSIMEKELLTTTTTKISKNYFYDGLCVPNVQGQFIKLKTSTWYESSPPLRNGNIESSIELRL
jgi:hypothetical protein